MKEHKICKVEGCNNKHEARGYCNKHYLQIKKYGRLTPELERKTCIGCKVEGCENKHDSHGYCKKHYMQIRIHGRIYLNNERELSRICKIERCTRIHHCKGYCALHYNHMINKDRQFVASKYDIINLSNESPIVDYEDIDIIELYKEILQGNRKRFPKGTWQRPDAISNILKVSKYMIEEVAHAKDLRLQEYNIEMFKKYKLSSVIGIVGIYSIILSLYPEKAKDKTCKIDGCNIPYHSKGYCCKHYNQILISSKDL